MRNYEKLDVWEEAHQLVLLIYEISEDLPSREQFALTDQIRRSIVSIPSNIAEGTGKESETEFNRFLKMARSSVCDLDYQLKLARDLEYITDATEDKLRDKTDKLRRILTNFIQKVDHRT